MTDNRSDHPVLIVAPLGQDAAVMAEALSAEGIATCICADLVECAQRINSQTGALLLTDEALQFPQVARLTEALKAQPDWSELPVIVLIRGSEDRKAALLSQMASTPGTMTVLERPMQVATLRSAVQVALRSRHRQYAVRDLLEERARLLENERIARSEAERSGRLKDEFLATLSHELRTPLSAILGWSKLIDKHRDDQKLVNDGIQVITRNAKLQGELIADLLDMSRIISGRLRLEIENVDLSGVVQLAIDSVRPAADAKQIRIETAISSIVEPVRGDPHRLQQVVWNLLTNAVKFTPKGGTVQVVLSRKNSHAELTVSDTGKGIEPDFLPFVFDRFRQSDASTTRESGGLGLGLAIVKELVALHGGQVGADSPGKNQGSTFTVELPLSTVRTGAPHDNGPHHYQSSEPLECDLRDVRILAVDDELDARHLLKRVLEDCKAETLVAASGHEALNVLAERSVDVILCDIAMPRMDGYEFIRRVRELGYETPAVAVTALARTEDRTRALVAGFQNFVAKPLEPSELVAAVASLVKSPRGGPRADRE